MVKPVEALTIFACANQGWYFQTTYVSYEFLSAVFRKMATKHPNYFVNPILETAMINILRKYVIVIYDNAINPVMLIVLVTC